MNKLTMTQFILALTAGVALGTVLAGYIVDALAPVAVV